MFYYHSCLALNSLKMKTQSSYKYVKEKLQELTETKLKTRTTSWHQNTRSLFPLCN